MAGPVRNAPWMLGFALAFAAGCASANTVGTSSLLAGRYSAEVFLVLPQGGAQIDVLGAGGHLDITIDQSGSTSGALSVPATVPGGPLSASMAGTATINSLTVQFDQTADTFVRDLVWTRNGTTLEAINQDLGGTRFTITLVHH